MSKSVVRCVMVCGCLTLLSGTHGTAGQADTALSAPYQVEAVSSLRDRFDESTSLGAQRVVVDLGTAEATPWPDRNVYSTMTLIGTTGTMPASLDEIAKSCETLCGDDAEECHYVARLVPAGDLAALGDPLAAIADAHDFSDFAVTLEGSPRPATDLGALPSEFTSPIWPPEEQGGARFRFRYHDGSLVLDSAYGASDVQEIALGVCAFFDRGPLVRMVCDGVEALMADSRPILVSFPDYNTASADLFASFVHGGRTYHVVRLGIKAQTIYGLLYQDDGQWHARLRPRNYSLLC